MAIELITRHIDVWWMDWGCRTEPIEVNEQGTEKFRRDIQCVTGCWHSYAYHTPPHVSADCEKYRPTWRRVA